jgi:hypothetical protein
MGQILFALRPGYELMALDFIYYGNVVDLNIHNEYEEVFNHIIKELEDYRSEHFGDDGITTTIIMELKKNLIS